ncbi:hypothetical protein F2P79_005395 [Pimephales promelas]|nr:hypothetical protein F2P79_005395 [Pimephales promelas]
MLPCNFPAVIGCLAERCTLACNDWWVGRRVKVGGCGHRGLWLYFTQEFLFCTHTSCFHKLRALRAF